MTDITGISGYVWNDAELTNAHGYLLPEAERILTAYTQHHDGKAIVDVGCGNGSTTHFLAGKMDAHFTALWDNGHIKFWSIATFRALLQEAGYKHVTFRRVGRIPSLAKSMIAIAEK